MSTLPDSERRAVMRRTWLTEARRHAPELEVRFVLGRATTPEESAVLAAENATHGDLVTMPCVENQHKGKTLHWLAYAYGVAAHTFDYVAKMDQDVYVWPMELREHLQGFAKRSFYGGVKVDVYFHYGQRDRFAFMNGGFAVLSMDLVAEVAGRVASVEPTPEGFIDHGRQLRGNEDVTLGRIFQGRWEEPGQLAMNEGDFPWSVAVYNGTGAVSEFPTGSPGLLRACPWRHAQDLKHIGGYERQWASRTTKSCRCNCPPEYSPQEAAEAYEKLKQRIDRKLASNPNLPYKTPEQLQAWKARMKEQQKEMNRIEQQRLDLEREAGQRPIRDEGKSSDDVEYKSAVGKGHKGARDVQQGKAMAKGEL